MHIAILASGAGSNARNIIHHFRHHEAISVVLLASNKPEAGVRQIAEEHSIPWYLIDRANFYETDEFLEVLRQHSIGLVVLAGFLLKIPAPVIHAFPSRIVNIHPSLLPKYGGKGMYGHFVHEAVHASGEKESGITIHLVNEQYDEGAIVFQERVALESSDTPADIEHKVRKLETLYYPSVIESLILSGFPE